MFACPDWFLKVRGAFYCVLYVRLRRLHDAFEGAYAHIESMPMPLRVTWVAGVAATSHAVLGLLGDLQGVVESTGYYFSACFVHLSNRNNMQSLILPRYLI